MAGSDVYERVGEVLTSICKCHLCTSNLERAEKFQQGRNRPHVCQVSHNTPLPTFAIIYNGKKIIHDGPKGTTSSAHGVGLAIRDMRIHSKVVLYGEIGKDICPLLIEPFLENVNRRSRKDESRNLIPVFDNSRRKG